MSELASYSIQAVFFALVAVVVVSRSKKTDLYQFALISIWLIGVIAIYAKYKDGQIFFYSNDQDFHRQVIEYYLPVEGFHISAIISLRYLLTIPVYLVSLLGFNAMLIIKFLQLSALLLLYKRSQQFLSKQSLQIRFWQLPLIAGPILIFMSLLSLRDVMLAYFALLFVSSSDRNSRILGLGGAFLLRPHLGVALAIGFILSSFYWFINNLHIIDASHFSTSKSYALIAPITPWIMEHMGKIIPWIKPVFTDLQSLITAIPSK